VRLTCLGHAFWLLESGGLRVAMDPVLGARHTAGLFEILPRRTVDARSLRPDFVLVSHAHFDHFDVESLDQLARLDADAVVVTPDPLVAEVCSILGFRSVKTAPPGTRLDLAGGLSLTLTPSRAPDVEWGVLAADASGAAWNMVDTLLSGPDDVRRVRDLACRGRALDVALAPLQPMREVALATADFVGFMPDHHRHFLACAAATGARCVVPSAAGDAHAPPFDAMNAWVYPISAERAARDLAAFAPATRLLAPALGDTLTVDGGAVSIGPGRVAITRGSPGDPRVFRPIDPAPLADPNLDGAPVGPMRERLARWVHDDLQPAIERAAARPGPTSLAGLELVLEVVLPDDRAAFSLRAGRRPRAGFEPEYDVLNVVAGSMLLDVIEGRRAWYEPLLAGLLRSAVRGCAVTPGRADPLLVGPMFVYEALDYRRTTERAALSRARAAVLARSRGGPR
jgi:L-ascorbate metabolism protein UlaG (beta-lactamase superfamily)